MTGLLNSVLGKGGLRGYIKVGFVLFILTLIYTYTRLDHLNNFQRKKELLRDLKYRHDTSGVTRHVATTTLKPRNALFDIKVKEGGDITIYEEYPPPKLPTLPKCAPGIKLNGDDLVRETLEQCVARENLTYHPVLESWKYTETHYCDGKFVTFVREYALLRDAIIDKQFCSGKPCEENIDSDSTSFDYTGEFSMNAGFFKIPCNILSKSPKVHFKGGYSSHITKWFSNMGVYDNSTVVDKNSKTFTVAIKRYEYRNLYHTMSDLYNVFLAVEFFSLDSVDVLFIDGAPSGPYMNLWNTLFNSAKQMYKLPQKSFYHNLLWNEIGYDSDFLNFGRNDLGLIDIFIHFVLDKFKIAHKEPHCDDLTITVISRKDYDGRLLSRKIGNEIELVESLKMQHAGENVTVHLIQLEELSISEQLALIAKTDVLVGMHGAGLTHSLFLPPHAGIIELFPLYWKKASGHFEGITRWRGLHYMDWRNADPSQEHIPKQKTNVPSHVFLNLLSNMISKVC